MHMRMNWQCLMHAPTISTFASHSTPTLSSSRVLNTTLVVRWWTQVILCRAIANSRMAQINGSGSSVPSTNNTITDLYIPYWPLFPNLNPSVIPHYVSLALLLYLAVASVYRLELHLIPFPLTISCHWNCLVITYRSNNVRLIEYSVGRR